MFEKIIEKINKAEFVGIFTHINPDGDALGSSYSLKNILESMGKKAEVFISGDIELRVNELIEKGDTRDLKPENCDLLIAVDSADLQRLGEWSDFFIAHKNTIAIDHHKTHVKFAGETVVKDISSTCELMVSLYREMGIDFSMDAAKNLYIGIVTDTGNFKYSSVTANTHRVAAELIEKGIDFADIAKKLFDTVTKEYLMLKMHATEKLEFYCDEKVALLTLANADFEEYNISEADSSSLVVFPCSVKGVEVGVYIRQRGDNEYKVSLRSVNKVDVAEIACKFGGGGHTRASGYSVDVSELENNIKELIAEITKQLD